MKKILWPVVMVAVTGCGSPVKIEMEREACSAPVEFAAGELHTLMAEAVRQNGEGEKYRFRLQLDTTLKDGAFALAETAPGFVVLRGGDPAGVSHAVYSLLEEVGYTFDITGITRPEKFDPAALRGLRKTIVPKVRWRGVRQHVNFPMDISSYPVEEAEAYLENLVRMRFNKLSVHSYAGQWYERTSGDSTYHAGHFFYGDRHYFYDSKRLKNAVRFNDSTFCIPVAEPFYDDEPACSAAAITWMRRLIAKAKTLGMMVQFSFEPRMMTPGQTAGLAHRIMDTYPQIDALELMTTETGGWGTSADPRRAAEILRRYFDPAVLNDSLVMALIHTREVDVEPLYTEIGLIAQALAVLRADSLFRQKVPQTKFGIYCTVPGLYASAYRLARLAAPEHVITLLPSHGADGVAEGFPRIVPTPEELGKAELYSWIEFDGLMYLQQNPVEGIGTLLGDMQRLSGGVQIPSVQFNHWRTAENRTAARYAAEATLFGTVPAVFYRSYAARLGITDTASYARVMALVNEADTYSTHDLINVGFCWMGAWRGEHAPFNYVRTANIQHAIDLYLEAGELLSVLPAENETTAAKEYLKLLGNRILASIYYLEAFRETGQVVTRERAAGTLMEHEKTAALEALDRSLLLFDRYMETCAYLLPDRGSEGTLVSVWNGPVYGAKLVRSRIGGIPMDTPPRSEPVDAPPLPILIDIN